MKRMTLIVALLTLIVVMTACGPGAPPAPLEKGDPEDLVGTTWKAGEFEATFKEDGEMLLYVESQKEEYPEGVEGRWKVEDGIFEAQALDQIRTGTWDGVNLVVDGVSADRIEKPKTQDAQ